MSRGGDKEEVVIASASSHPYEAQDPPHPERGRRSVATRFLTRTWILYLIFLPLPIAYLLAAPEFDPRAVLLARIISVAMIAMIIVLALKELLNAFRVAEAEHLDISAWWAKWYKAVGIIGLMTALVPAIGWLGFYIPSAIFMFAALTLLDAAKWPVRIAISLVTIAVAYGFFERVLDVPLP